MTRTLALLLVLFHVLVPSNGYTVSHTGPVFTLDVLTDLTQNPYIQKSASFFVTNSNVTGGLASSVDPTTIPTYGSGIIGLYNFESSTQAATIGTSYSKGTSDCGLPAPIICTSATLTGDKNVFNASQFINNNGRYGKSLYLPFNSSTITFADVRPGPFARNQPAIGMSQGLWMKSITVDSTTGAPKFKNAVLTELQWGNFDVGTSSYNNCIKCSIRGMNGAFQSTYCLGANSANVKDWTHIVCTYHAVTNQLTLYVNGTTQPSSTLIVTLTDDLFLHGDYQPIGIGNRPGTNTNLLQYAALTNQFEGLVDDVAFWNRPLTQQEVSSLYQRTTSLVPAPRVVLETENIVRVGNEKVLDGSSPFANEFAALSVSWNISDGSNTDSLIVQISTDNGENWCQVANGAIFTDKLHGGPDLICLFPSITIKLRVVWGFEQVTLSALSVQFFSKSPLEPTWQNVPVGMNPGGVTYWISSWPFVDVFESGGATSWPAIRSGTDSDGYPLEIDPAQDVPSGVYWITGRNILMCCNKGNYPGGNYTLIASGNGLISLAWDSGYKKIPTPCRTEIFVKPTNSGIELTIERSTLGNHVHGIQMWMPGFAPPGKPFVPPPTPPKTSPSIAMAKPTSIPVKSPPLPAAILPTSCPTCLNGIVGYWPFDILARDSYSSSVDGTVRLRAFSPAITGESAVITGTGSMQPLTDDDCRFGKCLVIASNKENFAQLFDVGLLQSDPATGFAASVWLKGSGGYLFERMFSNFQIDVNSNNICCTINNNNAFKVCSTLSTNAATSWTHVACSYNGTAQQLSLYVNGQAVSLAAATITKFNGGDKAPFGLGNRAGSATNLGQYAMSTHFVGKIDDFALWKRSLNSMEVWYVFSSGKALYDLYPRISFPPSDCITCLNGTVGYWTFDSVNGNILSSGDGTTVIIRTTSPSLVGANATITGSGSMSPIIANGVFGAAFNIFQGTGNWAQIFPSGLKQSSPGLGVSSSIWLRPADVTFSGLIFERMFGNFQLFGYTYNNALQCSIIGTNGVTYYASYNVNGGGPLDVQKWYHIVCTYTSQTLKLYIDGKEKASVVANLADGKFRHDDNQPLGLGNRAGSLSNPAQYASASHFVGSIDDFALWSRALTSDEVTMLFASGKPLHLQGKSTTLPQATPTQAPVKKPSVRPSKVPTFTPSSAPTLRPTKHKPTLMVPVTPVIFHPEYLKSLKNFTVLRFMDWGTTNSAQHTKWNQRNTPTSVSQARSYTVTKKISSIKAANGTVFLGGRVVLVTTTSPHCLVTGQRVTISNSNGNATMTNGATTIFDVDGSMVQVVDDSSFLIVYGPWWWDSNYIAQNVIEGNQGLVSIRYSPGVSIEYQVELCNTLGVDGWFNVPHLADDDYVFNMAVLINNTLSSNLKAYIEYSNEVWNWAPGFVQTRYASAMALAEGDTSGDRHLKWYGRKSSQVFSIFDRVFGSSARTRLVRVVAVQAGSGSAQMSQVGFGGADALAIGAYFGHGLNSFLYNSAGWQNITVDQVLDQARKAILSNILASSKSSAEVAKSYGLKLIAYEGGQHFGGGGNCGAVDCSTIADLQTKLMAANHSPRMKGLYQNMLKAWSLAGGATFAAFSHIGYDSRYGSWGALQHQMEDRSVAWKWQALTENIGS